MGVCICCFDDHIRSFPYQFSLLVVTLLLWSLIALLMALLLISLYCCFTPLSILLIRSMNALISSSSSSSFLRPFFALGKQDQATAFLSLDSLVVPLVTFSSSRFPPTYLWLTVASAAAFLPPYCCCCGVSFASLCSLSAAPPATLLIPCYCCVVKPWHHPPCLPPTTFDLPRLQ